MRTTFFGFALSTLVLAAGCSATTSATTQAKAPSPQLAAAMPENPWSGSTRPGDAEVALRETHDAAGKQPHATSFGLALAPSANAAAAPVAKPLPARVLANRDPAARLHAKNNVTALLDAGSAAAAPKDGKLAVADKTTRRPKPQNPTKPAASATAKNDVHATTAKVDKHAKAGKAAPVAASKPAAKSQAALASK